MGTTRIGPIILIICMMGLGLFITMTVLTGAGNVLGNSYRFILPAAFALGCVAPRTSVYLLVIMAGYLDLPKKILVAGGRIYYEDLFYVLGTPSVMVAGIVVHYLASFALRVRPMTKRDAALLILAGLVVGLTALIAVAQEGVRLSVLKALANTSAYYSLIFFLPLVLRNEVEVQRFLRFVIIVMIPAALHAIWHYLGIPFGEPYGLFDFERDYMESGFSINLKYLLSGEGVFGPFSGQGPLATTMSLCAALCLTPLFFRGRIPKELRLMPTIFCLLLFVLYTTAAVLSLKRGPLLIIPGVAIGMIILRSGILTVATYAVGLVGLIILVVMGESFAEQVADWQTTIYNIFGRGETTTDLFRVRTFHTRFIDFSMLKDPENWQPFGSAIVEGESAYFAHSLIVRVLLTFGYVPIGAAMALFVPVVIYVHRRLIKMSKGGSFEVFQLRFAAAAAFSLLGAAGLGILSMTAYPNPFFFGVFLAIMASALTRRLNPAVERSPARVEEGVPVLNPGGATRLPASR